MKAVLPVKIDKGSGTPLVFLHGLGYNHTSWEFVLKYVDDTKWRVITLDLLGFGDAPKPDIQYTPKQHAQAVITTLESLAIKEAVFVGHSLGCNVAVAIAHHYPEYTQRLVLLGAPIYQSRTKGSLLGRIFRTEGVYFSLFETIQKNPETIQTGSKIVGDFVPFIKGMEITPAVWPAYKKSLENSVMQFDSYTHVISLRIPVLFICGFFDVYIIRGNIRAAKKANPDYITTKTILGPHELTPRHSRTAAGIINRQT